MIERVARELYAQTGLFAVNRDRPPWEDADVTERTFHLGAAMAVIKAMRATFENVQAGYDFASERCESAEAGVAASNLQTAIDLIDSALSERREKGNG